MVRTEDFRDRPEVLERAKHNLGIVDGGVVFASIGALSRTTRVYAYKPMGSHTCYRNFLITEGEVVNYAPDTIALRHRADAGSIKKREFEKVLQNMRYLLAQDCSSTW